MIIGNFPQGGLDFPDVPEAGNTTMYALKVVGNVNNTSYFYIGAGWGFTTKKAGTYRITYAMNGGTSTYAAYAKLQKNNVDIANSEMTNAAGGIASSKTIDVSLSADDIVKLWVKRASGTGYVTVGGFTVSFLAADIQSEIDNILTPTTT